MKENKTQRSPRESDSGKCAKTAPKTQNGTDPLGFLAAPRRQAQAQELCSQQRETTGASTHWPSAAVEGSIISKGRKLPNAAVWPPNSLVYRFLSLSREGWQEARPLPRSIQYVAVLMIMKTKEAN